MNFTLKKSKLFKTIVWSLFLLYLALLIKVILFKDWPIEMIKVILQTNSGMPLSIRIKDSNFIPMKTILYYLAGNQSFGVAKSNILGNIIAFGPFGFLLPIIIDKIKKLKSVVIFSFILSLTFELVQLFASLGEFDIDDILLNTLGGICGYMIYKGFIYFIFKRKNCDVKSLM